MELAEKIGISRQSVYAIESGKFDPSLPVAFRIAELFGIEIEEVFSRRGPVRSAAADRPLLAHCGHPSFMGHQFGVEEG